MLEKLSSVFEDGNYLVTNPSDLKYLMGNAYIAGLEFFYKNRVLFLIGDHLNLAEAKRLFGDKYPLINTGTEGALESLFSGVNELIVDENDISIGRQKNLLNQGVKVVIGKDGLLINPRKIKTPEEITLLKESQRINYQTFEIITPLIKPGMTESDIAKLIKVEHLKGGASGESFEPVVAINEGGAEPHHKNNNERKIKNGDQILIDMGCVYEGYCSDMTRVLFLGGVTGEQMMLYQLLIGVTNTCLRDGKIGMTHKELHNMAMDLLGEYGEFFTHSLSHGIGIDIHEFPRGSKRVDDRIMEGEVFTIEPGIYIPGKYGFRYEIMVVATKDGFIEL